ncbi:MAG: glycosyltransferase family A protein [Puniceicoccaceae bacterium]
MNSFPLEVFVFSYNRGPLLRHCLESVVRHLPEAKVTVVDDGSTDPGTLEVLENPPGGAGLMQPRAEKGAQWYGGLYANMREALRSAQADYVLFTQDDAQVVRPVERADADYIRDYFGHFTDAAFLNPVFPLAARRSRRRVVTFSRDFPTFFYTLDERFRDRSVTMYYTDISIASTRRLREADWDFQQSEGATAAHARRHFGKMGCMIHPFLCQLPEVPFYRSSVQTWAMKRIMEKRKGVLCAFRDMTPAEVRSLRNAPPEEVPYAENWLRCTGREPKRPFRHKIADAHPGLKLVHKLELSLRKRRRRARSA